MCAALCMILVACGGGGDSATAPPAQSSGTAGNNLVTAAPASSYADVKLANFQRLNAVRMAAGLGAFTQNGALDSSAQAHVGYLAQNPSESGHFEVQGHPGFTGITPRDRMIAPATQPARRPS